VSEDIGRALQANLPARFTNGAHREPVLLLTASERLRTKETTSA